MKGDYWNKFYSGNFALDIPSQFCAMFCQEAQRGKKVIEFGCGNGRDTRVMASHGFKVLGIDSSESAIEHCMQRAGGGLGDHLHYLRGDVSRLDTEAINSFVGSDEYYIYSRFFQHSITEEEQEKMFASIGSLSSNVIGAYFEFRNEDDRDTVKLFGTHYRRYQSAEYFGNFLKRYGFDVDYSVSGTGYAKYFDEDPNVTRIIARLNK